MFDFFVRYTILSGNTMQTYKISYDNVII